MLTRVTLCLLFISACDKPDKRRLEDRAKNAVETPQNPAPESADQQCLRDCRKACDDWSPVSGSEGEWSPTTDEVFLDETFQQSRKEKRICPRACPTSDCKTARTKTQDALGKKPLPPPEPLDTSSVTTALPAESTKAETCAEGCSDWDSWEWQMITGECPDPNSIDKPALIAERATRVRTRECSNLKEGLECFAINGETRVTTCKWCQGEGYKLDAKGVCVHESIASSVERIPATCDSYATANDFGALVFKLTKCAQDLKTLDMDAGNKIIASETIAGWKDACCLDMTCKQYDDGNSANLQTNCNDSGGGWDDKAIYTGNPTDCCQSPLTCEEKFNYEANKKSGVNAMLNARLSLNNKCIQEYSDNAKPVWDIRSTTKPAIAANCCIPLPDRWTPSPNCAQEYYNRGGDENAQKELNEVCKWADQLKPVWIKFTDKKAHADNCCRIGPTCNKEYFDRGNNEDAQQELNEVCKFANKEKPVWNKIITDKPAHATYCCRIATCAEKYYNMGGNEDAQDELDKVCKDADQTKPIWEHFAYTTASTANCCRSGHTCNKEYLNRKQNSDATSAQNELDEICKQADEKKPVWDIDSKNKPATAACCCVKGCAEVCSDWNLDDWQWKPTMAGHNPRNIVYFEKVTDKCPEAKDYDEPKSYLKTRRVKTRECSNLKEGQECFAINSETRLTPCCQEKFVCGGRHRAWGAGSYSYTGVEGAWWDKGKCNCLKPYAKSADDNQNRLIVVSGEWVFDSATCDGRCVKTENTDHFPKNLPEFIYAVVELDQLGWWKDTDTYPEGGRIDYENRVIAPDYGENLRVAIRFRVNREFEQPDLKTEKSIELQCELQEVTDDTEFTSTTSIGGQMFGCNDKYSNKELDKLIRRNQAIPEIKIKIISNHPKPAQKDYVITPKEHSVVGDKKCVVTKSRYPYSGYDEKEAVIRQLSHTYKIPRATSLLDEDNYFYFNMNYLINVDSADQVKRTFVWGATECEKSTRHTSWGAVRAFDKSLHIGKKLSNNKEGQEHTDAAINFIKLRINPDPNDRVKITAPITYEYEVRLRGQLVHQFRTPAIQQQIIEDHFPEDL